MLVVIRHVNECTLSLCVSSVQTQLTDEDELVLVTGKPFSSTLASAIHTSINTSHDYSIHLDGDILVSSDCLRILRQIIKRRVFSSFQTCTLDYLFAGPRLGGIHVYNRSSLVCPSKLPGLSNQQRPETYYKHMIATQSLPNFTLYRVLSLHDYDQSPSDYYRKAYLFYFKNRKLVPYFSQTWTRICDASIKEALFAGFSKASRSTADTAICTTDHVYSSQLSLPSRLSASNPCPDRLISAWLPPSSYLTEFPTIYIRLLYHPGFFFQQIRLLIHQILSSIFTTSGKLD